MTMRKLRRNETFLYVVYFSSARLHSIKAIKVFLSFYLIAIYGKMKKMLGDTERERAKKKICSHLCDYDYRKKKGKSYSIQ